MADIEEEVSRLAPLIGASENDLPDFHGKFLADLCPNVRANLQGYHYIISERGQDASHIVTHDLNELLYLIFKDVAFSLATRYELAHRVAGQDSRRLWFSKEVELLAALRPAWGQKISQEQRAVLAKHPLTIRHQIGRRLRGSSASRGIQMRRRGSWLARGTRCPLGR